MMGQAFEVVPCGDDALRILCGAGDIRHDLAARLTASASWTEIVPGKQDICVAFDPHVLSLNAARARVLYEIATSEGSTARGRRSHTLIVEFGGEAGPDLSALAERLSLSLDGVVDVIEGAELSVDMLGFTPGFAYLAGLDPALVSERLGTPRTRVPAGSVGLITGQIGLYALDGPGGWPIVGRVQSALFDKIAADPFLLRAGDWVVLRRKASV
jgi:KipI family sensor histidine kinase inhibitor